MSEDTTGAAQQAAASEAAQTEEAAGQAAQPGKPAPKGSPKAIAMGIASKRHAIPFLAWIGVMFFVQVFNLSDDPASKHSLGLITAAQAYAARVALCVIALLICRPWRYYEPLRRKNILPAIGAGAAVFLLWVCFESDAFRKLCPWLANMYETWCVMPAGKLREPLGWTPYAPETCGWPLTAVRFAGSAFVIAIAEEFFWRGFLYRWIQSLDFLDIDLGKFHLMAFAIVMLAFGIEHTEWLAGVACGALFGWMLLKTKDIWALVIAHVVANFLLAAYSIAFAKWQFL